MKAFGMIFGAALVWALVAAVVQLYALAFFEAITWRAAFGVALPFLVWCAYKRGEGVRLEGLAARLRKPVEPMQGVRGEPWPQDPSKWN